jgi:hypothetical protein
MRIIYVMCLTLAIIFAGASVYYIVKPKYIYSCGNGGEHWKIGTIIFKYNPDCGKVYSGDDTGPLGMTLPSAIKTFPTDLVGLTILFGLGAYLTRTKPTKNQTLSKQTEIQK